MNEYNLHTTVFDDEWEIVDEIGHGNYGTVYKIKKLEPHNAKASNEEYCALKVVPGCKGNKSYKEIERMHLLENCSHIVHFEDYESRPGSNGYDLLIRMELLEQINRETLKNSVWEVLQMGIQICDALISCEKCGIIHGDIKPSNILVNKHGQYKLGDFGIARMVDRTIKGSQENRTYAYMAPEVYEGKEHNAQADIYSLGLVLYKFLNKGQLPFCTEDGKFTRESINVRLSGEKIPPIDAVDPKLNKIVCKACEYNPRNRYRSAEELQEALLDYQYEMAHTESDEEDSNEEDSVQYDNPIKQTDATEDQPAGRARLKRKKPFTARILAEVIGAVLIAAIFLLIGMEITRRTGDNSAAEQNPKSSQSIGTTEIPNSEEDGQKMEESANDETVGNPELSNGTDADESVTVETETSSHDIPLATDDYWNTYYAQEVIGELNADIKLGETVTFGSFQQEESGTESSPIQWIVLLYDEENEKVLLLSKYGLRMMPYSSDGNTTWENSSLRSWLNSDFIQDAFTEEEQEKLVSVNLSTASQNTTDDEVFCIGHESAYKCIAEADMICYLTPYAKSERSAENQGEGDNCGWWLRDPGEESGMIQYVGPDGTYSEEISTESDILAVRPLIWVDISE